MSKAPATFAEKPNKAKVRATAMKVLERGRASEIEAYEKWREKLDRGKKGLSRAEKQLLDLNKKLRKAEADREAGRGAVEELLEGLLQAIEEVKAFKDVPVPKGPPQLPTGTVQTATIAVVIAAALAWVASVRVYHMLAEAIGEARGGSDGSAKAGKAKPG